MTLSIVNTNTLTDLAGNELSPPAGTNPTVHIDTVAPAPQVSVVSVDDDLLNSTELSAGTISVTINVSGDIGEQGAHVRLFDGNDDPQGTEFFVDPYGEAQTSIVSIDSTIAVGNVYSVTIDGQSFSYTVTEGDGVADVRDGLISAVNAGISGVVTADTETGESLRIVGQAEGIPFTLQVSAVDSGSAPLPDAMAVTTTQAAKTPYDPDGPNQYVIEVDAGSFPSTDGDYTISAEIVAADEAGNWGEDVSDPRSYTIDATAPTATITIQDGGEPITGPVTVNVTFIEPVSDLSIEDFAFDDTKGSLSDLTGSGTTYQVTYTPFGDQEAASISIGLDKLRCDRLGG